MKYPATWTWDMTTRAAVANAHSLATRCGYQPDYLTYLSGFTSACATLHGTAHRQANAESVGCRCPRSPGRGRPRGCATLPR